MASCPPPLRTSPALCWALLTQAKVAASPERLCPLVARGPHAATHPQAQRAVWPLQAPLEISSLLELRRGHHSHSKALRGTPGSRATGLPFQVSAQMTHTQDLVGGYPEKPILPTSVGLFQEVRMEAKTESKVKIADCKGAGGRG